MGSEIVLARSCRAFVVHVVVVVVVFGFVVNYSDRELLSLRGVVVAWV